MIDEVKPGSQADAKGLHQGDVIVRIGDRPATNPQDVMRRLSYSSDAPHDSVALLVRQKAATKWVTIFVGRVAVSDLLAEPEVTDRQTAHDAQAAGK